MRAWLALVLVLGLLTETLAQGGVPSESAPEGSENARVMLTLETGGHIGTIYDLVFTPEGRRLISVGRDATIQVWDAASGERLKVFRLPRGIGEVVPITRLALAPDGRTLAVGGAGITPAGKTAASSVLLLHLESGQVLSLKGPGVSATIRSLSFSADGGSLAVGGALQTKRPAVWLWRDLKAVWAALPDSPTLRAWKELSPPKGSSLREIALSPDGKKLATYCRQSLRQDSYLHLWDLTPAVAGPTAEIILEPHGPGGGITQANLQMTWSPDGERLATLQSVQGLRLWSAAGKPQLRVSGQDLLKLGPAITPGRFLGAPLFRNDREILVARRLSATISQVVLIELDSGKRREWHRLPETGTPLMLSPDGQRVAWAYESVREHHLALFNAAPLPQVQRLSQGQVTRFTWSKAGYQLAWTKGDLPARLAQGKLIGALDLASMSLLPAFEPAAFQPPDVQLVSSAGGKYVAGFSNYVFTIAKKAVGKVTPLAHRLLQVYVSGQDWVIWTKEGYYAASPGGEKLVGWQVNNGPNQLASFYPVARFRKRLYRPDVIALVLEKGSVAEALKAADAARGQRSAPVEVEKLLPPQVSLRLVKQEGSKVTVQAKAAAAAPEQPITALRLLLNGRLLSDGAGLREWNVRQQSAEAEWTIELPAGRHQLSVLARSPDVSGTSPPVAVEFADPTKQPRLHVLAVGINAYQVEALRLNFARADAEALLVSLAASTKTGLFQPGTLSALLDAEASSRTVFSKLAGLRSQARPNDLVVLFFAGHGVRGKDEQGKDEFYLLTAESNPQALTPASALAGRFLRKALSEFPCQVLLLLDACHSSAGVKAFRPATDELARDLTDDEVGVTVLSAAMAHQKAQERAQQKHGLFTAALLEALKATNGVPFNRHDQRMYVHHLHSYVYDEVTRLTDFQQSPFLSLPWTVESYAIRQLPRK